MELFNFDGTCNGDATYVIDREAMESAGVLPSGPACPWPQQHVTEILRSLENPNIEENRVVHDTAVKASISDMAKGLFKNAGYAIKNGRVSSEIREERYAICKTCPHFIEDSKRCSECGCFMEAKTWVGADPNMLCPKQKWPR